jgi:Flp pilus assembly protein TadD
MKSIQKIAGIVLLCLCIGAWASSGGGGGGAGPKAKPAPSDPVIANAQSAIASKEWGQALDILGKALSIKPNDADYHNLYAYSMRHSANPDMEQVFSHYAEALRIDPKHRGAHEYLGEAYLQVGQLAKAKEQLSILDKLCFFPCEEYSDLKVAVAFYEAGHIQ